MKRSMFISAMAGLAALAAASASQAQAPAAPDPARVELARQVIEATGGEKGAEAQIRALYGSIGASVSRNAPPAQAKTTELMMRDMQEEMVKLLPAIMDVSARAYAQNLSDKQLRDLLVFYKSDSGQALINKLPAIMQQSMAEEMPLIQAMIPEVMQKTLDRVCAETSCTPEVRQQMADAMAKAVHKPAS
ncbi:MAG: DUF2059 domain-containing protein [Phenylobacterium sp.]|nr:MAG: DUF2059 domain-containing protein [Phenylobacterium sp.]